jgi:hypothetical protein
MKELLAARAQRGDDVLEVRRGSCNRTEGRGIERTPPHSQKRDRGNPARHLEAATGDVLVWNAVCRTVIAFIGTRSGQSQSVGLSSISSAVREITLLLFGEAEMRVASALLNAPVWGVSAAFEPLTFS